MITAVIFDLDGTVLDNEGVWREAFEKTASSHGLPPIKHEPGIGVLNNWKKLVKDLPTAQQYSKETKELYMKLTGDGEPAVREGVVELVEEIKALGWQTALASGSEWHNVEKELEQLNLYLAFDVTTTGEEVLAGKPDPEIYLLTIQKMGLEPKDCVVIEDSVAGIESALDAGCLVIGIANEFNSPATLKAAGAKLVVDSLAEVMLLLRSNGHTSSQNQDENSN